MIDARGMSGAALGPVAGFVGPAVFGAGSVAAALAFGGPDGFYSPLNRWVSELGEVGVSSLGLVFNAGLIVGGLGFAGFMTAFAAARGGALAMAAGGFGLVSGIFGALVGVFPLGGSDLHRPVAIGFFVLGAVAVALASVEIAQRRERTFPAWLAATGGLVVAAFVGFIVTTLERGARDVVEPRPAFLVEPALEWAAVGGILVWTAVASIAWARQAGTGRA